MYVNVKKLSKRKVILKDTVKNKNISQIKNGKRRKNRLAKATKNALKVREKYVENAEKNLNVVQVERLRENKNYR